MDDYYWDVDFTVKIEHMKPPESTIDELRRSERQTYINYKAYNWINNKDNLRTLLDLIFKEDKINLDKPTKIC